MRRLKKLRSFFLLFVFLIGGLLRPFVMSRHIGNLLDVEMYQEKHFSKELTAKAAFVFLGHLMEPGFMKHSLGCMCAHVT